MLTEYLKSLKSKQNLTNQQIAQMSGISESTISRILKGENKNTDLSTCVDIIRALGGSIDEACGIVRETKSCNNKAGSCADCPKLSAMQDEFMQFYAEEIRKDIIETTNTRVSEYRRITDARIENEKEHYEKMIASNKAHYDQLIEEKNASMKERIDNLMTIINARAKTINRLFLVIGVLSICLIALLILNIFFPTNPILKW